MKNNTKAKKIAKITIDVIMYIIAGILLISAVVSIILKFSNNAITLFGHRFDVVLTDSMSEKNPKYEDFLKGHDDQVQPLDLVVTDTRITEKELQVYDIVLFNNKDLNVTDMHRIVGKTLKDQDEVKISNSYFQTINGIKGFSFRDVSGGIVSNVICATQMTLVTYSTEYDEHDHFRFSYTAGFYPVDVTREEKDGGYYTTYHFETGSTSPRRLAVAHAYEYDYSSEVISSCVIETVLGTVDLKEEYLVTEGTGYSGIFNQSYYFEIRGDKAGTSDGTQFTKDDIYGKVVYKVPKIGYLINYLSSIWGMISLIGLGAIIITFDVVSNILTKKELAAKQNNEQEETIKKGEDE